MALWQTDLLLVPRKTLSATDRTVPDRIPPDVLDRADFWNGFVLTEEIERTISSFCPPRRSWSSNLKTWGDEDGNRIDILHSGASVAEVSIRIDVRHMDDNFIEGVIALATYWDCVFVTEALRVLPPVPAELRSAVQESEAHRFVSDPHGFLDSAPTPNE